MVTPSHGEDRSHHWNRIHEEKAPDTTSWYQASPVPSLELIEEGTPLSGASVLDVGCGTSPLVEHLLGRGCARIGALDVSGRALERLRTHLGDDASRVEWMEEDVTRFHPPSIWDVWHDRAVYHFLTEDDDRRAYREAVRGALKPGGTLVLGAFGPDGPTRCSGLPCERYDAATLQRRLGPSFRLERWLLHPHRTPSGSVQEFLFARFRRQEDPEAS